MKLSLKNYGWLDPFGQRYVGSRKGAAIGDATLMKLGLGSREVVWTFT